MQASRSDEYAYLRTAKSLAVRPRPEPAFSFHLLVDRRFGLSAGLCSVRGVRTSLKTHLQQSVTVSSKQGVEERRGEGPSDGTARQE